MGDLCAEEKMKAPKARVIGLKEFETLCLSKEGLDERSRIEYELRNLQQEEAWSQFLPSLDVRANWSKERQANYQLTASVMIPKPSRVLADSKQRTLEEQRQQLSFKKDFNQRRSQLRNIYFKLLTLYGRLENQKLLLALAKKALTTAENRYQGGYISRVDYEKSKLSYRQFETELNQISKELLTHKQIVGLLAGLSQKPDLWEIKSLKLRDTKALRVSLRSHFSKDYENHELVDLKLLTVGLKQIDLKLDPYEPLTPDLSLSASMPISGDGVGETSYSANLSWNLFSQGRHQRSYRQNVLNRQELSRVRQNRKRSQTIEWINHKNNLLAGLETLDLHIKTQDVWKQIVNQSLQRFESGHTNYQSLNDDISSYTKLKSQIHHQQAKIWSELELFMVFLDKPDEFYKFLQ